MLYRAQGYKGKKSKEYPSRLSVVPQSTDKLASLLSDCNRGAGRSTVMVVDDRLTSRQIISELLLNDDASLSLTSYGDPKYALEQAVNTIPDLVITDYKMPSMNGIEFMKALRALPGCHDVPVMIVTVCEEPEIRYRALQEGVNDFLVRPLDQYECQVRCRNLLRQRKQQYALKTQLNWLQQKVMTTSTQAHNLEQELLLRLARAGEYRDEITGAHVLRMAKYARLIGEELGLSIQECEEIELAAPMHDIGKIGIPDEVLLKPGKLSNSELEIMKQHAQIGYEILKDSSSSYMQLGAVVALNHHERFDGTGYPNRLSGEEIPLIARIVAVADVFDALTSSRPYKNPWSSSDAVAYLRSHVGTHFDPDCVDAFLLGEEKVNEIKLA